MPALFLQFAFHAFSNPLHEAVDAWWGSGDGAEEEEGEEGAKKAGRDMAEVNVAEYIRICVDDDEEAARKALARATLGL